jgi:hypothetical protein
MLLCNIIASTAHRRIGRSEYPRIPQSSHASNVQTPGLADLCKVALWAGFLPGDYSGIIPRGVLCPANRSRCIRTEAPPSGPTDRHPPRMVRRAPCQGRGDGARVKDQPLTVGIVGQQSRICAMLSKLAGQGCGSPSSTSHAREVIADPLDDCSVFLEERLGFSAAQTVL